MDAIVFGQVLEDYTFPLDHGGFAFAMSADFSTIAVVVNDYLLNSGPSNFYIRVYQKSFRGKFEQIGPEIKAPIPGTILHLSLDLSADGTTIAVGVTSRKIYGSEEATFGEARIFQQDTSNQLYKEIVSDINGEGPRCTSSNFDEDSCLRNVYYLFRTLLAISADGSTIAVRAPFSTEYDLVRVYQQNPSGQMYEQIGSDINVTPIPPYGRFGGPLAISADGTIVAVGSPNGSVNGFESGQVRVYEKDLSNQIYNQVGSDINGDIASRGYGTRLGMSADGNLIGIGTSFIGILVYQNNPSDQTYKQSGVINYPEYAYLGDGSYRSPFSISADGTRIVVGSISDNYDDGFVIGPQFFPYPVFVRVFQKSSTNQTYEQIEFLEIPGSFGKVWTAVTADATTIAVGVLENKNYGVQVFTARQCVFGLDDLFCPFTLRTVLVNLLRSLFGGNSNQ